MPKVSVLIPAYNAEKYIEKCIDSVLLQTMQDIEIIVIDDGSTDETGNIIDSLARKDSRLLVFHQQNQGVFKTRQNALFHATGDYIGWVDADDFVSPKMFGTLYKIAEEKNADLIYCDYNFYPYKVGTKEKWFRPYKGKKDVTYVERNSQLWNKLVKRKFLESNRISCMFPNCFDESYIKILIEAKVIVSIPEPLYYYRMGQPSISSSYKNVNHYLKFIEASENLKKEMEYYWKGNNYWKAYFEYREIYYMLITMLVAANSNRKDIYLETKKRLNEKYSCFHRNLHIAPILHENFGILKGNAIEWCIPFGYNSAKILCAFAFPQNIFAKILKRQN